MLINALWRRFERSGVLAPVIEKLESGEDAGLAVPQSARPLVVALLYAWRPRSICVVVPGEEAAERFGNAVAAYIGREHVWRIPERHDRPWDGKPADSAVVGRRLAAMHALAEGKPGVTVASARALLRCVPAGVDIASPLSLAVGRELPDGMAYEDLSGKLVAMGYQRADGLDGAGTFAMHGDTVDIFPSGTAEPVRVEFFGDEVDGIRRIVSSTGQTIGDLARVDVYPAGEVPLGKEAVRRATHLLEPASRTDADVARDLELLGQQVSFPAMDRYLPYLYEHVGSPLAHASKETLIVVAEPRALFDDASRGYDDACAAAEHAGVSAEGLYLAPAALDFGSQQRLSLLSIMRLGGTVDAELEVRRPEVLGSEDKLYSTLHALLNAGVAAVFSVPDHRVREEMRLALVDHSLPIVERLEADGDDGPLSAKAITVTDVDIPAGLIMPGARLGIVSMGDVSPRTVHRHARRTIDPTTVTFPYKPGDYVVHATHGIALFKEVVRQEVAGIERDYLLLEYAGGDKLYVPVEQIDRVTRFVGPTTAAPRLTRLNSGDWARATGKARKAAKRLAFDLVDLYARRATVTGHRYGPDTPWQHEMEADFPYEETPDQLSAIADVKADMESDRPMDRLICGDVGFGKTEVVLRAAFKAVQDGKQVMVLCPTTILAQQHFTTFSDRMSPYGVRVEVLSRFRTAKQQREALEGFADGKVDVLVGTHRLLSSDVNPKDLGLVVIDEEQRFGVQHKEQLKNMREQVDVLSLSATPIPRTMQMALSGVRDMSVINTPPGHRMPVKVHVGEWDPDVVSQAIRFEIARGGQVYYVSNRVKSIDDAVRRVHDAAPEARVGVAHGQMDADEVERAMESFAAGEVDVLVATTIIESGIDNPHTNTLVIEDAQRLGLAQLYQLKGRVGRSGRQAYAYFMFPDSSRLTEQAIQRLTAISENQDLGSGMRIAMKDLEIRGAGSLLGAEQHGNMSAVGFDLFSQMLQEAVSQARGEAQIAYADVKVDLPVRYFLPEEYMPAADERVAYYRRIAGAEDDETLDRIAESLTSRYGELPEPAENLIDRSRVKAMAADIGATSVTSRGGRIVIEPVDKPRHGFGEAKRAGGLYLESRRRFSFPLDKRQPLLPQAMDALKLLAGAFEHDRDADDLANYSAPVGADGVAKHEPPGTRARAARATGDATGTRAASRAASGSPAASGKEDSGGPVKGAWTRRPQGGAARSGTSRPRRTRRRR